MTIKRFLKYEYSKLVNYTRKQLREVFLFADPEDIVHDVALNIYSKVDLNTPIENLAGYFYRSIKNKITDYQRSLKFTPKSLDENQQTFPENNEDEVNEKEIRELHETLKDNLMLAIDKLKPEQRLVLLKTEFEGISFNRLSEKWGIPMGTLLARKHRAIANLRKIMNEFDNN